MYSAMHSALKNYSKVILMGSDCPFLDKTTVYQSITALDKYDMVFSPTSDGGYVLLGAKDNISMSVFNNINWGSESVMNQTRNNLTANNFNWKELSEQHDIDTENDLKYLSG